MGTGHGHLRGGHVQLGRINDVDNLSLWTKSHRHKKYYFLRINKHNWSYKLCNYYKFIQIMESINNKYDNKINSIIFLF